MSQFQYVDSSRKLQTFESPDATTALKTAPDLAKDSGVMLLSNRYPAADAATPSATPAATPTTPATTPTLGTVTETPLEKASRLYYEGLTKTVDPAAIREQVRQNMQGQIDATNNLYDNLITSDRNAGDALNNRVRGLNINNGLGGSDFATANAVGQETKNKAVTDAREKERAAALSTILGNIDARSQQEIKDQTATANKNSQDYLTYLKDRQDKASSDIKSAAGLGITYDQFKTQDPTRLTNLLTQTGLDEQSARALFIANAPDGVYVNKDKPEIVNNQAIFFKQNKDPITGKTTMTSEAIPLPAGTDEKNVQVVTRDDGIYIINKIPNKDGSYTTTKVGAPNTKTTGSTPSTAKISVSEAKAAGLPLSVVGQSEADIVKSLGSTAIPQWFVDKAGAENGVTPSVVLWNAYRKSVSESFGLTGGGA